ncbi:Chromatin modification-related protein YNG2 [Nosema granulosis]|uniref:Chromatin modification-related protein YNG2 n=1 Tax=Nosema granulosis TaxID=83296 RepID=A0A9P6H127_9MICR|nr:Chromatin modification-related protein YNG2 [Nosema granulosis]
MSIFDTFDKVIENVQQIPLDVYLFVKKNQRLTKKIDRCNKTMKRLQRKSLKELTDYSSAIEENYKKLKKYNRRTKKNIENIHNVLLRIYSKDSNIIRKEQPHLSFPVLNIDNINRIVKINKMMVSGPVYCNCKQRAFDNMIACNNTECKYKWFHFECIGITHPPKNVWYCQECKKKCV